MSDNFRNVIAFYESQDRRLDREFQIPGDHSQVLRELNGGLGTLDQRRRELVHKISELERQKSRIRPPQQTRYTLKGVIIHEGTVNYGHYYSYVHINQEWFCFDDLQVEAVTEHVVMSTGKGLSDKKSANCYCLVYVKGDPVTTDDKPFLPDNKWAYLPQRVKQSVEEENEKFDENLENELGKEILENLVLEHRAHRGRFSRNDQYRRFVKRFSSFLMFLEDSRYMGMTRINPRPGEQVGVRVVHVRDHDFVRSAEAEREAQ